MQATGLTDAERQALGKNATEAALYARLAGQRAAVRDRRSAGQPGQPEGQSFDATLDQALFLSNGTAGPRLAGAAAGQPDRPVDAS